MPTQVERFETACNPLDSVEEVLTSHDWVFNRMNDDELMVQVTGKSCSYRLFFIWQEDMSALQFCCQYDMTVTPENTDAAAKALLELNENLWMGHFDLPADTNVPSFRHTCLMRGVNGLSGIEHIEDLVDISLAQCERHYPVFHLLSHAHTADQSMMDLALMNASGEA